MTLRRVAITLWVTAVISASSWALGQPPADRAVQPSVASHAQHYAETLADRIDDVTDNAGAVPALPGVRPPFVPRAALAVTATDTFHTCTLDAALSGRCPRVVAWIP